ncbi:MAG: 50S ribosomal protein L13 [Candidatus Pacebacteria bacterium]|nr:50S ribosomal protein L13 [Candidatus Paceibacterota bacterium]
MKIIDAQGKSIGRVATEAAMALMGKDRVDYEAHIIQTDGVHILNASKVVVDEKKLSGKSKKVYRRYTGYPGGLKDESMTNIIAKKGYGEVFKKAIRGMLPANKHRPELLKRIEITE